MKLLLETFLYIEGKKFADLIPFKVEQTEAPQDRMDFVEALVKGKAVLHIGCLDHLPLVEDKISQNRWFHGRITESASECLGLDINQVGIEAIRSKLNITNIHYADIENPEKLAIITAKYWDYVVFGEIIEHVDNPVDFLHKFSTQYQDHIGRIILTVPNAFRAGNLKAVFKGLELINTDHRYWFSPYTIWKIVHQAGLTVENIQLCKFSPDQGISAQIKNLILKQYPLLAEDIVVVCGISAEGCRQAESKREKS